MDFDTVGDIVQRVLQDLSMAPGSGTQRYAEDRIAQQIVDGYFMLSRSRWWDRQCRWYTRTLDGVTGIVTSPFTDIISFQDVQKVLRGDDIRPLSVLPSEWNPFAVSGTSPRYVEAYEETDGNGRLFRVWPLAATGTIRVRGRKLLARSTIVPDTTLNFDEYALRCWAAWHYSEADSASPGQAGMFQSALSLKMKQLVVAENEMPLELDPRGYEEASQWQEMP